MKASEPFSENPAPPPRAARMEPLPHNEPEEEFEPRYLDLPSKRQQSRGRRNLVAGVGILVLCVPFFGWALYLGGPATAMILASCLATATALYVIARARVFHQPNGGFLAMSLVCVVGIFVALSQQAWLAATRSATAPAANATGSEGAAATPAELPSLVEAYSIPAPDPARGRRARVLKESRVTLEGKNYVIRPGDTFPLIEISGDDAVFLAGSQEIKLRKDLVEVLYPSRPADDTEEATPPNPVASAHPPSADNTAAINAAKLEAVKRYPGIGVQNSPENSLFVAKVNEMKAAAPVFFQRPDWPLEIAEALARTHGWKNRNIHVVEDESDDAGLAPAAAKNRPPPPADEPVDKDKPAPEDNPTGSRVVPPDQAPPPEPTQPAPPAPVRDGADKLPGGIPPDSLGR